MERNCFGTGMFCLESLQHVWVVVCLATLSFLHRVSELSDQRACHVQANSFHENVSAGRYGFAETWEGATCLAEDLLLERLERFERSEPVHSSFSSLDVVHTITCHRVNLQMYLYLIRYAFFIIQTVKRLVLFNHTNVERYDWFS